MNLQNIKQDLDYLLPAAFRSLKLTKFSSLTVSLEPPIGAMHSGVGVVVAMVVVVGAGVVVVVGVVGVVDGGSVVVVVVVDVAVGHLVSRVTYSLK